MYALRQPSSFEFGKYGAVVFPSHEDAFNYELLNSLTRGAAPSCVRAARAPGAHRGHRRQPGRRMNPVNRICSHPCSGVMNLNLTRAGIHESES